MISELSPCKLHPVVRVLSAEEDRFPTQQKNYFVRIFDDGQCEINCSFKHYATQYSEMGSLFYSTPF